MYSTIYTKGGYSSFFTLRIKKLNNHLFKLEWDRRHCQEIFMRNTMIPIVTFLAPSFWMSLPSKVIHKPKDGLS